MRAWNCIQNVAACLITGWLGVPDMANCNDENPLPGLEIPSLVRVKAQNFFMASRKLVTGEGMEAAVSVMAPPCNQ